MNEVVMRSGEVEFRPRARLLRLIGSELISDEIVAITELVKNAHDADASQVCIQFLDMNGKDAEIHIRDDGHGMDLDTLLSRWMQPAGSSKGRDNARFTARGRRVLGEKGVGRFAADKLARHLELVSRSGESPFEISAVFDWDRFDGDDRMLSEVTSRWEERPAEWLESSGTMLRLTGLRTQWNERLFRRLCTRLSRLVSPTGGSSGFAIKIESDDYPDYAGEVQATYLESAPHRIEARFDGAGIVSIRKNGAPAESHRWLGEPLTCGPARIILHAFDLETEALARIGPRTDVRAWLREWSGVSVYRDGFRVWPYGEPHDDWLRLDQRRVNTPVLRLSNNQVVGLVEIGSDTNPELRDQTNREGLLHNGAFADLQRLVLHIFQLVEAERQATRHPKVPRNQKHHNPAATATDLDSLPSELERLAAESPPEIARQLGRLVETSRQRIEADRRASSRQLEGYSELAALGHTTLVMGRSVSASLRGLAEELHELRGSLVRRENPDRQGMIESVRRLVDSLTFLQANVSVAMSGTSSSSRRRRSIEVPAEVERCRQILTPVLDESGAEMEVRTQEGVVLRVEMRPESFQALVSALTVNALEWAAPSTRPRIVIAAREGDREVEVLFSDNGKGVTPGLEDRIFTPGVSGKDEGGGMGLTICHDIVTSHGGSIELLKDRRRRGTTFRILLPRKRSKATNRSVS